MHTFYVDESYDESWFVLTAVCVEDVSWRAAFEKTKQFRRELKQNFGIKIRSELHAKVFIRDCSDSISDRKLGLHERRAIFELALKHISSLPIVTLNICLSIVKCGGLQRTHQFAVERLSNRVQTMMRATRSYAFVVFDEGKEKEIRGVIRRMSVFNPVPSAYGQWAEGTHRNIVLDRFIEDPFFKPSHASYFLQWADFAAFALLKQETTVFPFIGRWGYNTLFPILHPICFQPASRRDPHGIVR